MNTDQLTKQFEALIAPGKANAIKRTAIGMSQAKAATYRNNLKTGRAVSVKLKMYWLQKAGVRVHEAATYTRADMLAVAKFILKAGKSAKEMGAEYLLDKYFSSRK